MKKQAAYTKIKQKIEQTSYELLNDIISCSVYADDFKKLPGIEFNCMIFLEEEFRDTNIPEPLIKCKIKLEKHTHTFLPLNIVESPYVCSMLSLIPPKNNEDGITADDIDFMKSQNRIKKSFCWDERIKGARILDFGHLDYLVIREKNKTKLSDGFLEISVPLFNIAFTKAYIGFHYYVGSLNAWHQVFFFEKIKGKWRALPSHCSDYRCIS